MKQNPFSLYDFLGYIIPGVVFLYLIFMIFDTNQLIIFFNLNNLNQSILDKLPSFVPITIIAYLIGHILAITSSAIIETFSNIVNGYPSEFLFYEKSSNFFDFREPKKILGRLFLGVIIFPIFFLRFLLNDILKIKMFHQAKILPDKLKEATHKKCIKVLNEEIGVNTDDMDISKGIDGDYLRLLYHFIYENSERHAAKLQNYVALYGLTRNISFVFILIFWIYGIAMYQKIMALNISLLIMISLLSYIFYIGFVKFYRRYSLEAIMATSIYKK